MDLEQSLWISNNLKAARPCQARLSQLPVNLSQSLSILPSDGKLCRPAAVDFSGPAGDVDCEDDSGTAIRAAQGVLVLRAQLLYGLKLRMTEQARWRPQSSLIVQGHTPASGPDPATALSLGYASGWELPDDWKLNSAIRLAADNEGGDRFEEWSPSVVLDKSLGERWNIHAEYFSHFSQNKQTGIVQHHFSPGVHYLVTPNLELGVRVGWGLNEQSVPFFSNVGVGFRF